MHRKAQRRTNVEKISDIEQRRRRCWEAQPDNQVEATEYCTKRQASVVKAQSTSPVSASHHNYRLFVRVPITCGSVS